MNTNEMTFEKLPEAVAHLIKQMEIIKEHIVKPQQVVQDDHIRMTIDEAAVFLGKAKNTIYTLSRKGTIPSYKDGKSLFFFRDELMQYQKSCRKPMSHELEKAIERENSPQVARPTRRY